MAVKDGRGSVVGYYRGETPTQGLWVTADYTPEGRATQRDWVAGTSCTESGTTQCPRLGGLPFGFHGAYKSPAHGLLYFRNRWYSVEAGQWLTHDPLGEVDSVNLYAFNRFDSVNFVDPFGLEATGPVAPTEKCSGKQGCNMQGEVVVGRSSSHSPEPPRSEFGWTFTEIEYAQDVAADMAVKEKGQGRTIPAPGAEGIRTPQPTTPEKARGGSNFHEAEISELARRVRQVTPWLGPMGAGAATMMNAVELTKHQYLNHPGVGLGEAAATAVNATYNPVWPTVEHTSNAKEAYGKGDKVGAAMHATMAVVSFVAAVAIVVGGVAGGASGPGTTRVGRWMSEAEYKAMAETGQVQAPLNGAGATHVTVPPNPSAFKPPPQSTHFVEFNVPTEQLRVHDAANGWGRVFGPGSLEARAATAQGRPAPTAMPPATNIGVTTP